MGKTFVKREDFDPVQVEKQSHAAKSLCVWCRALNTYDDISKDVEPKRRKMQEMELELKHAKENLQNKQVELDEVLSKVSALEMLCQKTQEELQKLEKERERAEKRLASAKELTG